MDSFYNQLEHDEPIFAPDLLHTSPECECDVVLLRGFPPCLMVDYDLLWFYMVLYGVLWDDHGLILGY